MPIVIGRICDEFTSKPMEFITNSSLEDKPIMRFKNCKAALLYLSLNGALQGLSVDQRKEQFKFMDAKHVLENVDEVDGYLRNWDDSMFIDYDLDGSK